MNNKITFPELVDTIAELTNTSKRVSEMFLKELFAIVKERLENGENVKIKGLGTFKVVEMASRKSVNVNSGEEMEIPAHRKVSFIPDKSLAEAINMPFEGFETIVLDDDFTEEDIQELSSIDDEDVVDDEIANVVKDDVEVESVVENLLQEETETTTEEEPQLPVFVPCEEDVEEINNQEEEVLQDDIIEEIQEKEDTDSIEIVETATKDVESQLPTIVYENVYDEEEHQEEVQLAKRKSFVWGLLAGLLVLAVVGYFAYVKGYISFNINQVDDLSLNQLEETVVDTIATPIDSIKVVETLEPEVVTDTIRANYYLTKMSRKHYGRYEFWVYIYEENKENIPNPNKVSPGMVVIIPPAEKYGIDRNNEESVKKALAKADEYK